MADELNVKEIKSGKVVELDLDLTTELIDEGDFRELLRAVQSLRKKHDLVPSDPINLLVISNGVTQQESKIENWSDDLQSQAQVMVINFSNLVGDNESNNLKIVKLSNQTIKVEINKA